MRPRCVTCGNAFPCSCDTYALEALAVEIRLNDPRTSTVRPVGRRDDQQGDAPDTTQRRS